MDELAGPGVIVVAERPLHDLLAQSGVAWQVQERQAGIGAMWEGLSSGRLDQHSRVLVFSDSLAEGQEAELVQTARAIVAMANAGAHVFVAGWTPSSQARLTDLVSSAAATQGIDVSRLRYHWLPVPDGGRATLDAMKAVLAPDVAFPAQYAAIADAPLTRDGSAAAPAAVIPTAPPAAPVEAAPVAPAPVASAPATPPSARPTLPPIGAVAEAAADSSGEYPPSASRELLDRPRLPGQTTITVTSSKGGSGKSTASILLAGSIARASRDAGRPLSVCLIDLDTRDGQVASLIGKFMPTALNIRVQPVWDEDRIRRNLVHADGLEIDCLLAPIRPRTADTVGPDFYRTIVRSLQRLYDVVIMDTSVQYLEPLIGDVALGEADEILFVTTLASTAVQGMARALREITAPLDESGLGVPREKIGIIVNQSLANVGMERDQVLAAGLGVPVVGVVPLATKDVLTATNLNRMYALLDHPLLGPAYNELARACLPGRDLAPWTSTEPAAAQEAVPAAVGADGDDGKARKGLFRR